ncbi:MAG TPA: hypothetical protein VFP65_13110 [Anaeromyxobacteraceae bacterium]|nr:hypothetical protein [Anaeromyxobacteraceae bacterium]
MTTPQPGAAVAGPRAAVPPGAPGLPWRAGAPALAIAALGLAAVVAFWARALPSPAPFEYVEGDTATWAWLWGRGADLYRAPVGLPLLVTNYPPAFLALLARLAPSRELLLVTGRLVSLGAYLGALALLGRCAAAAGGARAWGFLAALVAAHGLRADVWAIACRPDALAFALGTAGVAAASLRVRGWPFLAAACFGASIATKHSFVVYPVGVTCWALWTDRRRGLALAAGTALAAALVLAPRGRWDALVRHSAAAFRPPSLWNNLATYLAPSLLALGLAGLLLLRWRRLPGAARAVLGPWAAVFLCGLPWTASLGRIGSAFNYLLELLAAATVLATAALANLGADGGRRARWAGWALAIHAALAVALTCERAHRLARDEVAAGERRLAAAGRALAAVPAEAPVLAEQTWWLTAHGRTPLAIPFLATQLAARGLWDEEPLVERLARGEVAVVLLEFAVDAEDVDSRHHDRASPAVRRAVRDRYRLALREGDLHAYVPR